jgi:hypothetical protein
VKNNRPSSYPCRSGTRRQRWWWWRCRQEVGGIVYANGKTCKKLWLKRQAVLWSPARETIHFTTSSLLSLPKNKSRLLFDMPLALPGLRRGMRRWVSGARFPLSILLFHALFCFWSGGKSSSEMGGSGPLGTSRARNGEPDAKKSHRSQKGSEGPWVGEIPLSGVL